MPSPEQSATEDAAFSFTVPSDSFADVDAGDVLSYSASLDNGEPLPGWLSFDAVTRTFSGTPGNGDVGSLNLQVTATDAAGASVSQSFAVAVANTNDAPVIANALAEQSATEDAAFSFTLPADSFSDSDADDVLSYSVSLDNGEPLPEWLSFDAATRTFSGTPGNDDVGSLNLQVTATDAAGASVSQNFAVAVANTNDAPVIANALSEQSATEDAAFSFTVPSDSFADVDASDVLSYSASLDNGEPLPEWLSFDAATRTFSGTPGNDDVGSLNLQVTATDVSGASVSQSFAVAVANTNDAPVIANALAEQSAMEDAAFSFTLPADSFSDSDADDVLSYSASLDNGEPLPEWLSFDAATRTFSGTPGNDDVGSLNLQVTATDAAGASVSQSFAVAVENTNDTPVIFNAIAEQSATEDAAFSFIVPSDSFADVDASDVLSYSASLDNGEPLPEWLSFDAATRTFSGTPGNDDVGSLNLQVTATDAAGASVSQSFAVAVENTNDTPVIFNVIAEQSATEDAAFSFIVPSDSFADVDASDVLSYSASLDNGEPLPEWLSFDAATRTFSGTPGNDDVGSLNLQVTATDAAGASVSQSFAVAVENTNDTPVIFNVIAEQSATEDAAFSFIVPSDSFADVDASDVLSYSASLDNGESLPEWLGFDAVTRTFSGTPGNADVGSLNLQVTATDVSGASVSQSFAVAVANTNDAPVIANALAEQSATADTPFIFTLPDTAFSDADAGDTLSYNATLADGQPLPAWLSFDAATRTLSGTPAQGDAGDISFSITATDLAGASASQELRLKIEARLNVGVNLTGDSRNNLLTGTAGNDTLNGGAGSRSDDWWRRG